MTTAALQINNAQCQRAGELLFQPISVDLAPGQLAVISGPNGSGKTTLLESLAGLRPLTKGSRIFNGSTDSAEWLNYSHYLGHKLGNKGGLSCIENLEFVAHLNQQQTTEADTSAVLTLAGLSGYDHQPASDLSAGQKKRLALSRFILLNKKYWLLDEPFVNLDHAGCDWLYQLIENHLKQEGAVLLTAHDHKKIHDLAQHHVNLEVA